MQRTIARARISEPSSSRTPATAAAPDRLSTRISSTVPSRRVRLGSASRIRRIVALYAYLSDCTRRACTAGPLPVFSSRTWMLVRSALRAISPPSASISQTRWPFAGPPMEGLQGISATLRRFRLSSRVGRPIRALASAASQPACPAPTTTTSNAAPPIAPSTAHLTALRSSGVRVPHRPGRLAATHPAWGRIAGLAREHHTRLSRPCVRRARRTSHHVPRGQAPS